MMFTCCLCRREIQSLRANFVSQLIDIGFIRRASRGRSRGGGNDDAAADDDSSDDEHADDAAGDGAAASAQRTQADSLAAVNCNASNARIVKAVLCAALYPNVIEARAPDVRSAQLRHLPHSHKPLCVV